MDETASDPRASTLGYGIGVGLASMAIVGTVLHFLYPGVSDWLLLGGPFLLGAALGAWRAQAATVRLSDAG